MANVRAWSRLHGADRQRGLQGATFIPTTRTHLVRERLVSPWETVGPRFDSQKPRVSGAGARWPAGVLPLVSFDVGGAWWLFACRHGRLQALQFRNFIGCYPRIEWSLRPLVFNTPPDWVASVTISLSLVCWCGAGTAAPGQAPSLCSELASCCAAA